MQTQPMATLNGAPVTPDQLQTLALVNYGHFTSMRVDDKHIRGLRHHLVRLVRDCRTLFDAELDPDEVRAYVRDAVNQVDEASLVVRVTAFDPDLELGHPAGPTHPKILITTRPVGPLNPSPFRVQTVTFTRDLPLSKHVGLLSCIWHRRAAQSQGFDDALFVDSASFISEGATWNIGFHDGDRIVWPSADVLPGVTMQLLQQVHDQSVSMPVNLRDVPNMRAAFAANTSIGVRPIAAIDGLTLPTDGEELQTLKKEYLEIPPERI